MLQNIACNNNCISFQVNLNYDPMASTSSENYHYNFTEEFKVKNKVKDVEVRIPHLNVAFFFFDGALIFLNP